MRKYFVVIALAKLSNGNPSVIAGRAGRWTGTSENEALGAAVKDALAANPGCYIGTTSVRMMTQ